MLLKQKSLRSKEETGYQCRERPLNHTAPPRVSMYRSAHLCHLHRELTARVTISLSKLGDTCQWRGCQNQLRAAKWLIMTLTRLSKPGHRVILLRTDVAWVFWNDNGLPLHLYHLFPASCIQGRYFCVHIRGVCLLACLFGDHRLGFGLRLEITMAL